MSEVKRVTVWGRYDGNYSTDDIEWNADPEGKFVLYTDAVKMQREAYVEGRLHEHVGICNAERYKEYEQMAEALAARRYKEE